MSINKDLPPCYFTSIFIGSKVSGNTYSVVKLLKNYEKYPLYDADGNKLNDTCYCILSNDKQFTKSNI